MGLPAARIGDMHTCPMVTGVVPHVGGPILPPCEVTVLTGKIPQARMGDMCTCVGPPDSIIKGSMTVLVGKRPAARMGDMTVHGGVIVVGCPTVLIGDAGAGGGGGGGGAGFAMAVNPECQRLSHALEDAMMANHTYGEDPALPPGVRALDPKKDAAELQRLGVRPADLAPAGSTFRAEIFARETPAGTHYTVAFRGTAETADWGENVRQGVGMQSDHYDRAKAMARSVDKNSGGNVSFTGHSLGGGLASAAAVSTGKPASTFNAAGLSARTVGGYPDTPVPVDAYYVPGEVLSGVQDNRAGVLAGIAGVAGAIHPSLGGFVAGWVSGREMGDSPVLPPAYGARRRLPDVVPAGKTKLQSLNPVDRHGMDWVMNAIRAQQVELGCM